MNGGVTRRHLALKLMKPAVSRNLGSANKTGRGANPLCPLMALAIKYSFLQHRRGVFAGRQAAECSGQLGF